MIEKEKKEIDEHLGERPVTVNEIIDKVISLQTKLNDYRNETRIQFSNLNDRLDKIITSLDKK